MGLHPSHKIRFSDASTFDNICILCGATDEVPGGWGALAEPCPKAEPAPVSLSAESDFRPMNDRLLATFIRDLSFVTDTTLPPWLVDGAKYCAETLKKERWERRDKPLRSTHKDRLALDCARLIMARLRDNMPVKWESEDLRQEIAKLILDRLYENDREG